MDTMDKTVNLLMKHGKKSKAERIVFEAFSQVAREVELLAEGGLGSHRNPKGANGQHEAEVILNKAINNVKPVIEIKTVRIAGTTYKVPAPIRWERQKTLALRWIIEAARSRQSRPGPDARVGLRSTKSSSYALALELIDALKKQGSVIKRRDALYQEAEHNRAFSHYRW
jgi:small subunit ribosomal protein S7